MFRSQFLASALAVTSAFAIAHPAFAQSPYQPQTTPTPTPDADALAAAMRQLAADPRDLASLITAGELSLKVGDASGAAALFKRAEQVDPMNGRVKAGMARILVTQERPGEALRYFDQAVGYGLDPRSFAGDRGLAYDLIGEGERAQRDYRLALKTADNDEVRRRYALSLGISGKQDAALAEIDTLLRRNDRGAWRTRAFILAMTGDLPGATSIATRMMPPGMAQGLQPFFVRLATLSASDKAFAVHFGEVSPTPQRLADARLIPALPVLGPDPDVRVVVAAAPPPATPPRTRAERRRRTPAPKVQVASVAPKVAALPPAPGFGRAGESPTDPARVATSVARIAAIPAPAAVQSAASVQVAATPRPTAAPIVRRPVDSIQQTTLADYARSARYTRPAPPRPAPDATPPVQVAAAPITTPASSPVTHAPVPVPVPVASSPVTPVATPVPVQIASATPVAAAPAALAPQPTGVAATPIVPAGPTTVDPGVQAASAPTAPTSIRASETAILAGIVSGKPTPAAEPPVAAVAETPPASAPIAVADAPTPSPAAAPATEVTPTIVATAEPLAQPTPAVAATETVPKTSAASAADTIGPANPAWLRRRAKALALADTAAAAAPRTRAERRAAAQERAAPAKDDPESATPRTARGRLAVKNEAEPATTRTGKGRAGYRRAIAAKDETVDTPVAKGSGGTRRTAAAKDEAEPTPTRGAKGRAVDRRALAAKDVDDGPAKPGKGKSATASTRRADDAKAAKGEPPRIWVQVAGGANENDLPKAWSAVQSRTPALKGKAAYSTPLRATNRVVTGPFKTDAEARAFVNQLAKQGVSAFPFTSEKGQKMAKLPPK